jgi:hypothetical protein
MRLRIFLQKKGNNLLFLKKKKQKDFIPGAFAKLEPGGSRLFRSDMADPDCTWPAAALEINVFLLVFLQKKKTLFFLQKLPLPNQLRQNGACLPSPSTNR